jgi:putative NADPH-quinone reductase
MACLRRILSTPISEFKVFNLKNTAKSATRNPFISLLFSIRYIVKMKQKILVILGHPNKESFCGALAESYIQGTKSVGVEVKKLYLADLNFDPCLRNGYKVHQDLEPDLKMSQELIKWAEHLVFVYPIWWGTMPALLKGFIDRVFLPGFAFKYQENSPWWDKLLTGKSAHLIVTMDAPVWFFWFFYRSAAYTVMKKTILEFCGVKPVRVSSIGTVKNLDQNKLKQWLSRAFQWGQRTL